MLILNNLHDRNLSITLNIYLKINENPEYNSNSTYSKNVSCSVVTAILYLIWNVLMHISYTYIGYKCLSFSASLFSEQDYFHSTVNMSLTDENAFAEIK